MERFDGQSGIRRKRTTMLVFQFKQGTGGPDITGATYDGISYNFGGGVSGLNFKPDGTEMYVVWQASDYIYQYTLSTPWNVSTALLSEVEGVGSRDNSPFGLAFKPDGTKMYFSGRQNDRYYQYTLSTPWDISTASYDFDFLEPTSSINPSGFDMDPDGTAIVSVIAGTAAAEYSMSPWDIDTANPVHVNAHNWSSQMTNGIDLKFNSDGTKMFVINLLGSILYRFTCATPYSLDTVTYDNHFVNLGSLHGGNTSTTSFNFNADYTKVFVISQGTYVVYSFTL